MSIPKDDMTKTDSQRISNAWNGLHASCVQLGQQLDKDVLEWLLENANDAAFETVREGLREALKEEHQGEFDISNAVYRDTAHKMFHEDGKCEVDSGATVSRCPTTRGDDDEEHPDEAIGAYVMAWVWVDWYDVSETDKEESK